VYLFVVTAAEPHHVKRPPIIGVMGFRLQSAAEADAPSHAACPDLDEHFSLGFDF
jgi:hypothetical protein